MSDKSQDSETFYATLYDLLIDPREKENVDKLLKWWNGCVIRYSCANSSTFAYCTVVAFSAHARRARALPRALVPSLRLSAPPRLPLKKLCTWVDLFCLAFNTPLIIKSRPRG